MRTLGVLLCPLAVVAWSAVPASPVVVSSSSPAVGVAPGSLATIYGDRLATRTAAAAGLPWPTTLGDMPVVWIRDSASNMQMALLLYVSSSQINMWIPPATAPGPATVSFPFTGLGGGAEAAALRLVPVNIQKVAPGLFSADGTGTGVAAASAIRIVIPTQIQSPVPVFACDAPATCAAVPIDVGIDAPIYLSLYGTGIRGASSLKNVSVAIGSMKIQPLYAGPQLQIPGLDQVNVPLPLSLRGSGLVNVAVTVDGVTSNAVQVRIQ